MNILNALSNLEIREDVIAELKEESLPLFIWGTGELAAEINEYLKKNGIQINGAFVSDEYYNGMMVFDGQLVERYEDIKEYPKFNVIMGHSNYEKISFMEEKENVNKVFYLFSVNYGIFHKTSIQEIRDYQGEFEDAYGLFEDEESRKVYLSFLKTRVSGNIKYLLEVYKREMNFFNNDIFVIDNKELYLDIGAFDGDTIRLFLKENGGKYCAIYALEPDSINKKKLEEYVQKASLQDVYISSKGAWNKKCAISFETVGDQISSVINNENYAGGEVIDVEPVDNMFSYKGRVTLLKINYLEGVEEALQGAESILKVDKPKLALTVGFDCNNIRRIPKIIKEINPEYKLFLRYNRGMLSALTLYAVVC
ncbi:MAG: FkbM family methyltransferase [Lachnospiraceae bacterium]|nr:FkbM family methyltransferase [Lachnospiraceae bacterium]